ncbi:MAG: hypothetical protein L0Y66_05955, partial [Myxococcaceae bacterium]|nr:hypothetical protein [Myxococcaceae bacterium]
LMTQGVERPVQGELMDEGVPYLSKVRYYIVTAEVDGGYREAIGGAFLFRTIEEAQVFVNLAPLCRKEDWSIRTEFVRVPNTYRIEPVELPGYEVVNTHRDTLTRAKTAKEHNEKVRDAHRKAVELANKTCAPVWEDWRRLRDDMHQAQRLLVTFQEYLAMCNWDFPTALRFLERTAGGAERIAEAQELIGAAWPQPSEQ